MEKKLSIISRLFLNSIVVFFSLWSYLQAQNQSKPNILWITVEDISPDLSFYNDPTAKTPNLDALSKESLIYDNAFATVGVCAPNRSAIITGRQPISIGTMHMRTGKDITGWGKRSYDKTDRVDIDGKPIQEYSAVIPDEVKCFTEFLRAESYYCTNNPKTDYQFAAPISSWDENGTKAHWKGRATGQPFFSVFNINDTHESMLWKHDKLPLTVDPDSVAVPPYLPDNQETRKTIARHYSNIEIMDQKVGEILNDLKAEGLYDNTIIFFYSDHGGPLPREKRAIYDSGLKTPLMIKGIGTVGRTDRMVSHIDLAPTVLSLAGIRPPTYMDGMAFAGSFEAEPRDYIMGTSDRFDEVTDRMRAIRTKDYLYIFNFFPEKPRYKDISYREQIPMMPKMLEMQKNGQLDSIQNIWFSTKGNEEFYNVNNDPYNIYDLSKDQTISEELDAHRNILQQNLFALNDSGQIPENRLINLMWPEMIQPTTKKPSIEIKEDNLIQIDCPTPGASIVYMLSNTKNMDVSHEGNWKLYTHPIKIESYKYVITRAERIGFKTSEPVIQTILRN